MITDLTTSSVALAVQGIAAEKKKIDIVVGAATSAISGSACTPYGFHWALTRTRSRPRRGARW
jgi:branched-chain amino acid transport system substrate-binding protein